MTLDELITEFLDNHLGTAEQERARAEAAEARINTFEEQLEICNRALRNTQDSCIAAGDRAYVAEAEVARLRAALAEIAKLVFWQIDIEADPADTSPEDMTAHINGLVWQIATGQAHYCQVVDRDGNVKWSATQRAYGKPTADE